MLLITTFLSSQLSSLCLVCALVSSMQIPPQIQHLQLLPFVAKSVQVPGVYFSLKIEC